MTKKWRATMRKRQERPSDVNGHSRYAGDTLIELLLSSVVLSLCGLALITAFGTSISASADYRQLATVDTVLRTVEESAVSQIQQQASPLFIPCGTDQQYWNEFAGVSPYTPLPSVSTTSPGYGNTDTVSAHLGAPPGFLVTFAVPTSANNIQYWNSADDQFVALTACDPTQNSPELITLTVTQSSSHVVDSGTFIVDDRGKPSTQGILSANPSAIGAGAKNVLVTITGQGFNNNGSSLATKVSCGGATAGPTTYNGPSSVSFNLSIDPSAPVNVNCAVTVTNGDGTSVTDYNVIYIDPAPTVTSASPSLALGTTNGVVTVSGTGFILGSSLQATIGPAANDCSTITVSQTQYLSPTSLALTMSIPSTVTQTSCDISLENGDYGEGTGSQVLQISNAETPTVVITSPKNNDYTNQTPTIAGTATAADSSTVTIKIYSGASATGTLVQTLSATQSSGTWSDTPSPGLPGNAEYTAVASQNNSASATGTSTPVTFVIDTVNPAVTITSPYVNQDSSSGIYYGNNASPTISGTGGTLAASPSNGQSADLPPVTVNIYPGATAGGTAVETLGATTTSGGTWSVSSSSLSNGQEYTARATQQDAAGNVGTSSVFTFVVDTVPPVVTNLQVTGGAGQFTATFDGGDLSYSATTSEDLPSAAVYLCTKSQYNSGSKSCVSEPTETFTATRTSGTTFSLSSAFTAGTYYLTVVQSDSAGNPSIPVSTSSSFKVS